MKQQHYRIHKLIKMVVLILISLFVGESYAIAPHKHSTNGTPVIKSKNSRQKADVSARAMAAQRLITQYQAAYQAHLVGEAQQLKGYTGQGQRGHK